MLKKNFPRQLHALETRSSFFARFSTPCIPRHRSSAILMSFPFNLRLCLSTLSCISVLKNFTTNGRGICLFLDGILCAASISELEMFSSRCVLQMSMTSSVGFSCPASGFTSVVILLFCKHRHREGKDCRLARDHRELTAQMRG